MLSPGIIRVGGNLISYLCVVEHWINHLKEVLAGPLPGNQAHALMSPAGRGNTEGYLQSMQVPARNSAVLLLLFPEEHEFKMVLIKRPSYDGVHSGQIALPGGKAEENDVDFLQTALRETNEEIGIDASEINILGNLSRIYIPPSNFLVYPYVGWIQSTPLFKPDNTEVEKILLPNVNLLLDGKIRKEGHFMAGGNNGFMVKAPYYDIENEKVWGATAAILSEFREILKLTTT